MPPSAAPDTFAPIRRASPRGGRAQVTPEAGQGEKRQKDEVRPCPFKEAFLENDHRAANSRLPGLPQGWAAGESRSLRSQFAKEPLADGASRHAQKNDHHRSPDRSRTENTVRLRPTLACPIEPIAFSDGEGNVVPPQSQVLYPLGAGREKPTDDSNQRSKIRQWGQDPVLCKDGGIDGQLEDGGTHDGMVMDVVPMMITRLPKAFLLLESRHKLRQDWRTPVISARIRTRPRWTERLQIQTG